MSDGEQEQGTSQATGAISKDNLSQQRPLEEQDNFYDEPMCPCEEQEPEPQSEYEVAGDWVTYDGAINYDLFEDASLDAAGELEQQMRDCLSITPPPASVPLIRTSTWEDELDSFEGVDELNDEWAAMTAQLNALNAISAAKGAGDEAKEAERRAASAQGEGRRASRLRSIAQEAGERALKLEDVAQRAVMRAKRQARMFAMTGDPAALQLVFANDESENDHDGAANAESTESAAGQESSQAQESANAEAAQAQESVNAEAAQAQESANAEEAQAQESANAEASTEGQVSNVAQVATEAQASTQAQASGGNDGSIDEAELIAVENQAAPEASSNDEVVKE